MSQHEANVNGGDESPEDVDDKKRGKKRLELYQEEMEKHFHMSQQEAARCLGVSVSTLKRRFYEVFNNMRWPYHHAVHGPNGRRGVLQLNQHTNGSSSNEDSGDSDDSHSSNSPGKDIAETVVSTKEAKAKKTAIVAPNKQGVTAIAVKQIAPKNGQQQQHQLHQLAAARSNLPSSSSLPPVQNQQYQPYYSQQAYPRSSVPAPHTALHSPYPSRSLSSSSPSNYQPTYYNSMPQQMVPFQKFEEDQAVESKVFYPKMAHQAELDADFARHHQHCQYKTFAPAHLQSFTPLSQDEHNHQNDGDKIVPLRPVVARYAPMPQRKHVSMSTILNNDEMAEKQISKFDYDSLVNSMQLQQQFYGNLDNDQQQSRMSHNENYYNNQKYYHQEAASVSSADNMRSYNNYSPHASNAALARRYQPYSLPNRARNSVSPSAFK